MESWWNLNILSLLTYDNAESAVKFIQKFHLQPDYCDQRFQRNHQRNHLEDVRKWDITISIFYNCWRLLTLMYEALGVVAIVSKKSLVSLPLNSSVNIFLHC